MGFNATPMVDVIFMLTIFFMLVCRFSSAEQIPMQLPDPDASKARVERIPQRVIVNCRLAAPDDPAGSDVLYSIGPNRPDSLLKLHEQLAALKRQSPGLQVVVRADKRIHYVDVRAAMDMIAQSDIEMLHVVAHVAENE